MIVQVASDLIREQKMKNDNATKVIVSQNIDGMTPKDEELSNLAASIQATGADIIKVVVNVADITEIAKIFHLLSHYQV